MYPPVIVVLLMASFQLPGDIDCSTLGSKDISGTETELSLVSRLIEKWISLRNNHCTIVVTIDEEGEPKFITPIELNHNRIVI